jgi:hypothetical protein
VERVFYFAFAFVGRFLNSADVGCHHTLGDTYTAGDAGGIYFRVCLECLVDRRFLMFRFLSGKTFITQGVPEITALSFIEPFPLTT